MNTHSENNTGKLIENLNDIIVKNYDASKGYLKAAENLEHPSFEQIFKENALQRKEFAGKLQNEIRILGGEPKNDSSLLGDAHRAWMDVKSAVASNKTQAVLEACSTGEEAAISEYDELLKEQVPQNIKNMVTAQRNHINQSLQHLNSLTK